jgi:hypothetical protein
VVALNALIQKLPIATTVIAFAFAVALFQHWRKRKEATHLAWWTLGMILYGAGTLTESAHALLGWKEWIFRTWYICGALLGAAPLAQGTVYLLLRKKTADDLSLILLIAIVAGSICVLVSPIDYAKVDASRLTGSVFKWQWVRWFSPFINLYALVFLAGGAIYSAWRYGKQQSSASRCAGNVLIEGIVGVHHATAFRFAEVFMAGTGSGLSQSYRLHCGQTLGSFRFRFSHA